MSVLTNDDDIRTLMMPVSTNGGVACLPYLITFYPHFTLILTYHVTLRYALVQVVTITATNDDDDDDDDDNHTK